MSTEQLAVFHNEALQRYEITIEGKTAFLEYVLRNEVITYTHTETPGELRGRGLAGVITKVALEAARAKGLKIIPQCSYVDAFVGKHPEYAELLA